MFDFLKNYTKYSDIVLACTIVGILMVLLFPVNTLILDFLLALSVAVSFVILMSTLFISSPLELSAFPTMLLITTLLRLSLNIASTRLILSDGHNGSDAAGHVIEAFGGFVMQGNVIIGLIVFLILTLINFIVITKGSGRIAEVAARFSLDAMPGKQMSIDADLAAGLIDENTAKTRRKNLEDESAFYGAMDGANKFVRGDAIAGLIITFINLVGGMIVGIMQKKLTFDVAVQTYTILTIGDGLVSQIPSLIISMSAGLLVTKAGATESSNTMIFSQLSRYPQALAMTSCVTACMALLPGLPFFPFTLLSAATGGISYMMKTMRDNAKTLAAIRKEEQKLADINQSTDNASDTKLDMLRLEIGTGLMSLVQQDDNNNIINKIKLLRQQIATDYGFVIPAVRVQDNIQLGSSDYIFKIKEVQAGRGSVKLNKLLMINASGVDDNIPGEKTKDPAFGLPAKWILPKYQEEAIFNNYTVTDTYTVIMTHMSEMIKEHITELVSYSEVQHLIDDLGDEYKNFIKDIIPDIVTIGTLQKVLQSLLSEMVSIRDLPTIIEVVADAIKRHRILSLLQN